MSTKQKHRKIRAKPGDLFRVDLGRGTFGFGQKLGGSSVFYDAKGPPPLLPAEIILKPILFRIWLVESAIEDARWPIVGHVSIEKKLLAEPWFSKIDPISGKFSRYRNDPLEEKPATRAECERLEPAAIWQPEHVVKRLQDHFAGRPNAILKRLHQPPNQVAAMSRARKGSKTNGGLGHGNFENDDAIDLVVKLLAGNSTSALRAAIADALARPSAYLEVDVAKAAVAAAAVVAALSTRSFRGLPLRLREWAQNRPEPSLSLKKKAERALIRIMGDQSELHDLWSQSDHFAKWKANLRKIIHRLGGAFD